MFGAMRGKSEDITVWSQGLCDVATDWDQTEVADDKTIMLVLTQPRNDFYIAANTSFMARELEDMHLSGEKTIQQWDNPVASGAYYQTRFVPGTTIELTRNPGFSRSPWPFIENRKLIKVTDSGTRQAQFRAGKTIAFGGINTLPFDALLEDLASGDSPRASGVQPVRARRRFLPAPPRPPGPGCDIRAREAVSRALDVDRLIAVLEGGEGLKSGPGFARVYQNWKLPEHDLMAVDYLTCNPQRTRELPHAGRPDGRARAARH